MTTLLAIDPGNTESAYVILDVETRRPLHFAKAPNADVLRICYGYSDYEPATKAIEMVASYGMPVGREVFETCVWIGRFHEAMLDGLGDGGPEYVYRRDVKLHHCHDSRANDSNVAAALVDRFAPGAPNRGKGTKAEPGWFHGFAGDIWQAYAVGVLVADQLDGYQP